MPSQGPNSPATAVEDTSVGTEVWNDPTNVFISDNVRSVSGGLSTDEVSHYLKATNFGFSIPAGMSIDGIVCSCERQADAAADNSVKIVKANTITGSEMSTGAAWVAGTDTVDTFGSPTSLWGTTWTADDINNSGFGFAVSAKGIAPGGSAARIDHMTITVYYSSSVTLDSCLPDADVTTTGWSTAPLFSKVNDASDATVIQATAS